MQYTSPIILGVTLGLLSLLGSNVSAAKKAARPLPVARLVAVEGAASIYRLVDFDRKIVTVAVPMQLGADIRGLSGDGVLHATLASIDAKTNRAMVVTHEGQGLVLKLEPAILQQLQIGAPLEFVRPERSERLAQR